MLFGVVRRSVPAHRPRADHVGEFDDVVQERFGDRVAAERPPARRHPEHDGAAVLLEKLHQRTALRDGVVAVAIEADAPDHHHRPTAMPEVGGVVTHPHARAELPPVVHHHRHAVGAKPAEVIHHGVGPTKPVRTLAAVVEDDVGVPQMIGVHERGGESLHHHAVDSILPHPLEVPQHGRLLEGTEHLRRLTGNAAEFGREPFVGATLRHVGPEIDHGVATPRRLRVAGPMVEAAVRAVPLRVEPALVAAEHLPDHRFRIDLADALTFKWAERLLIHRLEFLGRGAESKRGRNDRDQGQCGDRDGRHQSLSGCHLHRSGHGESCGRGGG